MKKSEAVQHLKTFMTVLQKYRSITREEINLSPEFLADMYPWTFGEKCPLLSIQKVLDRYDKTGEFTPQNYYNFMTILDKFMYEVKCAAGIMGASLPEDPPDVHILMGWEEE